MSQRASQGISDIPLKDLPIFDVKALIECNDESLSLNAKKTCQILSETVRNNKDVERTIVITSIVEIDERIFSTISGGGIDYNYQWDGSYGVKAYSSNYYNIDSNGEYRLDRVTGGWNISDNQLGYKDEKVVYGQSGSSSDAP